MMEAITIFYHGRLQKFSTSVFEDSLCLKVSVIYDAQIALIGNIPSYTSQEITPNLYALTLNNDEG